jgi:hypothetical protein
MSGMALLIFALLALAVATPKASENMSATPLECSGYLSPGASLFAQFGDAGNVEDSPRPAQPLALCFRIPKSSAPPHRTHIRVADAPARQTNSCQGVSGLLDDERNGARRLGGSENASAVHPAIQFQTVSETDCDVFPSNRATVVFFKCRGVVAGFNRGASFEPRLEGFFFGSNPFLNLFQAPRRDNKSASSFWEIDSTSAGICGDENVITLFVDAMGAHSPFGV